MEKRMMKLIGGEGKVGREGDESLLFLLSNHLIHNGVFSFVFYISDGGAWRLYLQAS